MAPLRKVTLINGDGIGPEVMDACRKILEAAQAPLEFEYADAGAEASTKYGTNLPDSTIETVLRSGIGLKGPTATGIGVGQGSANVGLRKRLDLYASLRPVRSMPGVKTRYEDIDLVVVPCTASKTAVWAPMFAPGTRPRPPTSPAQRSETMSP